MRKILGILFIVFCVAVSFSWAEVFNIVNTRKGVETLKARDKASGNSLWQSENEVRRIKHEGKDYIYIREAGSGTYGSDKKYKSWLSEAYYHMQDGRGVPYQTKLVFKDRSGKVIQTVTKFYDPQKKKAFCRVDGKEKAFEFKDDLIDKEFLGTALQNYPFEEKRDVIFHLLTNEPTFYRITVKYQGEETIEVDGKRVQCHKLEMIPDLGLLNILGAFVPKTYFWYRIEPPHDYVRYEGLESGLGTPYIVLETAIK